MVATVTMKRKTDADNPSADTEKYSLADMLALKEPIVLVGLMGAGKSTIGRRLARRLSLRFIDTDSAVEQEAGMSISKLFAEHGEARFRELEKITIRRLLKEERAVIATGGGAFVDDELRDYINDNAITIWLNAPIDVLVERVSRRDTRPLLRGKDKREVLMQLMEIREPAYMQAHLHVSSDVEPHQTVVNTILTEIEKWINE